MAKPILIVKKKISPVIYVLVALNVVVIALCLYFHSKYSQIANNPYPLIDVSRNLVPQSDFIVNIQPLRNDLTTLVNEFGSASISLYFEVLSTGANISINPSLRIWPASLAKLPLAIVAMRRVQEGIWKLNDQLMVTEKDLNDASGNLYSAGPNTWYSIERLLQELLTHSDNTAYNVLLRNIQPKELDLFIQETGLEDLFSEDGKVSAKEYSRILRTLYFSSFLERQYSQQILQWMDGSPQTDLLSAGFPQNVVFAHKYGENSKFDVYGDSGVVYINNRPCIISVIIQGSSASGEKARVNAIMKTIAEKVYQYISAY